MLKTAIITFSLFCLLSCRQDNSKLLVGKWVSDAQLTYTYFSNGTGIFTSETPTDTAYIKYELLNDEKDLRITQLVRKREKDTLRNSHLIHIEQINKDSLILVLSTGRIVLTKNR